MFIVSANGSKVTCVYVISWDSGAKVFLDEDKAREYGLYLTNMAYQKNVQMFLDEQPFNEQKTECERYHTENPDKKCGSVYCYRGSRY